MWQLPSFIKRHYLVKTVISVISSAHDCAIVKLTIFFPFSLLTATLMAIARWTVTAAIKRVNTLCDLIAILVDRKRCFRLLRDFSPISPFMYHNSGSDEPSDWQGEKQDWRIYVSFAFRRSHNHMHTLECTLCACFLETHSPWRLALSCRNLRRCLSTHAKLVADAGSSLVSTHKRVASWKCLTFRVVCSSCCCCRFCAL